MDKFTRAVFFVAVVWVLFWVSVIGGGLYIAWHFISKYW